MGAPDPRDAALTGAVRKNPIDYEAARKSWAFRPHQFPGIPDIRAKAWVRTPLDAFILAPLKPVSNAGSN